MYLTVAGVNPKALDSLNVLSSSSRLNGESLRLYRIVREATGDELAGFCIWLCSDELVVFSRWFSMAQARAGVSAKVRAEVMISIALDRQEVPGKIFRTASCLASLDAWTEYLKSLIAVEDPNPASLESDQVTLVLERLSESGPEKSQTNRAAMLLDSVVAVGNLNDPVAVAELVKQRFLEDGTVVTCAPPAIVQKMKARGFTGRVDYPIALAKERHRSPRELERSDESRLRTASTVRSDGQEIGSRGSDREGAPMSKVVVEACQEILRETERRTGLKLYLGRCQSLSAAAKARLECYEESRPLLLYVMIGLFGHDFGTKVEIGKSEADEYFLCFLVKSMIAVSSDLAVSSPVLRGLMRSQLGTLMIDSGLGPRVWAHLEEDRDISVSVIGHFLGC